MVYCPMTTRQLELYKAIVEKTIGDLMAKDTKKEEALPEKRKKAVIISTMLPSLMTSMTIKWMTISLRSTLPRSRSMYNM